MMVALDFSLAKPKQVVIAGKGTVSDFDQRIASLGSQYVIMAADAGVPPTLVRIELATPLTDKPSNAAFGRSTWIASSGRPSSAPVAVVGAETSHAP